MEQKEGIVISISNNYATIKFKNNFFQAQIRGNIKKNYEILVGDKVLFSTTKENNIVIEKILNRKNELYRPKIANIDQLLIVNSLKNPYFNTIILNKLLTLCNYYQIEAKLFFTKIDLIKNMETSIIRKKIKFYESLNYSCFFISNKNPDANTFNQILHELQNKVSLLTGVSGVGKSSFLNNLNPNLKLATNSYSSVLKHGKHTTTTTKLYFINKAIIADSPGFLILKLLGLEINDIANNFPVIKEFINKCKFRNCLHQNEPGCNVIDNLKNQEINQFFYNDYLKIITEFNKINI